MAFNSSNLSNVVTLSDLGKHAVDASQGSFGFMVVLGVFIVVFLSLKNQASVFTALTSSMILTTLIAGGLFTVGWVQSSLVLVLVCLTAVSLVINGLYPQ